MTFDLPSFFFGAFIGFAFCAVLAIQFVRGMREQLSEFGRQFAETRAELERVKALADSLWNRWQAAIGDSVIAEIEGHLKKGAHRDV